MSIATKTAGVLLAATALCGIGSLASIAYADSPAKPAATFTQNATQDATQLKSPQYSRGFHVTNLSGNPIKLLSVSGENSFEGRTSDGSVLQPGVGYQDFEMTYYFMRDTFNTLNYAVLDANGNTIATFHYLIAVGGDGSTASEFHIDSGNISGDANGTTLDVKDAAGTMHTISGDQAQAQAATLKQFCAQDTSATCTFTPTSETHVDGPEHVLATETNNGTQTADLTVTKTDDVSSSDSVDVSATLGGSIAGIVDASVTASYGHTWSEGHSFATGVTNHVPAGYYGVITAIAPMIRDTGNFTITLGNTTWNLAGVYFDTPNPDGAEHFGYNQHQLTQAQKDTLPKTAVVTMS
jgi:hypothetical protein